jgi:hypothetical protein
MKARIIYRIRKRLEGTLHMIRTRGIENIVGWNQLNVSDILAVHDVWEEERVRMEAEAAEASHAEHLVAHEELQSGRALRAAQEIRLPIRLTQQAQETLNQPREELVYCSANPNPGHIDITPYIYGRRGRIDYSTPSISLQEGLNRSAEVSPLQQRMARTIAEWLVNPDSNRLIINGGSLTVERFQHLADQDGYEARMQDHIHGNRARVIMLACEVRWLPRDGYFELVYSKVIACLQELERVQRF